MAEADEREASFRLPNRAEWVFVRRVDHKVERSSKPTIFSLSETIEWIKQQKPIIWLGSIFSVPEPAGFPSGVGLTKSLISLTFAGASAMTAEERESIVDILAPRWPLEALFDEFEKIGLDLSESLLHFFKQHNDTASPSVLHNAVVSYYQQGLACVPLCITTNWDTLQEKAFSLRSYRVVSEGPGRFPGDKFGLGDSSSKTIFIYHPHGSFDNKDVVCSFTREQRQLMLHHSLIETPKLFLGYSGYEPSLYMHLEYNFGQLWCIRDIDDLKNPSKRRLILRPNTYVFVGDLRELLTALGVLHQPVDFPTKYVALDPGTLPAPSLDIIRIRLLCSLDSGASVTALTHALNAASDPASNLRYCTIMRTLVEHIRDRANDPSIIKALLAAANHRNSEQLWISMLAHLLRHTVISKEVANSILSRASMAPSSGLHKADSPEDLMVYGFGVCKQRTNLYKLFLEHHGYFRIKPPLEDFNEENIITLSGLYSSDMSALSEFVEMLAFKHLRNANIDAARACFDYAATCSYLCGLWNAGYVNEWAFNNIDKVKETSKKATLIIPAQV